MNHVCTSLIDRYPIRFEELCTCEKNPLISYFTLKTNIHKSFFQLGHTFRLFTIKAFQF